MYNNCMNNEKVRQMVREILQPVYDELVDASCKIFFSIENGLRDLPNDEKEKIVKDIMNRHQQALITSFKAGIPNDFDAKLKEYKDGRK